MKTTIPTTAALALLMGAPVVQADAFTGFTMDFVDIGNAGNAVDTTGYGAVGYDYRMGTYEVSRSMIESYNSVAGGGPDITMRDMTSYGGNGANQPATGVSWNEAARFVNWMNTSTGYTAAYKFTTTGANDNIALWTAGDAGFDASNPFRNSNAHYFLPSEDEWYKAAYYDESLATYHGYATGSSLTPTAVAGGTADDTAVYRHISVGYLGAPAEVTNAGGLSPYGTMGQGGNVRERMESAYSVPNDSASEFRVVRGGYWDLDYVMMQKFTRESKDVTGGPIDTGFRVSSVEPVPEPSSVSLLALGGAGLILRRKRNQVDVQQL